MMAKYVDFSWFREIVPISFMRLFLRRRARLGWSSIRLEWILFLITSPNLFSSVVTVQNSSTLWPSFRMWEIFVSAMRRTPLSSVGICCRFCCYCLHLCCWGRSSCCLPRQPTLQSAHFPSVLCERGWMPLPGRRSALYASLLFASEHNILKFLKNTVANQEKAFVKTREALFIFIHDFVKLVGRKILDYALDIKVSESRQHHSFVTYSNDFPLTCSTSRIRALMCLEGINRMWSK